MFNNGWFHETVTSMSVALKVKEHLYTGNSKYQKLDVIDTEAMGRVLLLDELVMTTEKDEFYYHESISHIALSITQAPTKVMVIGGGDGGTVREVFKYPSIKEVELVEIDEEVINVSKKFFPAIACDLENPKLKIKVEDAVQFVKNASPNSYDSIMCDCTDPDPDGIAGGLISKDFYKNISKALKANGIYIAQSGSPMLQEREFATCLENARAVFNHVEIAVSIIPTYPGSLWTFLVASNNPINKTIKQLPNGKTKFWTEEMQEKFFTLPNWIKDKYFSLEKSNK